MNAMNRRSQVIPRIKVCGVTLKTDLDFLASAGVDTIGLNFVPHSPRYVTPKQGQELSRHAAELGLRRVAVTMNPTADELEDLLSHVDVDFVQLHGRERPVLSVACRGLPIIKATSWTGRPEEIELVTAWRGKAASGELVAWLVDAHAPESGGGTGHIARWDLLQPRPEALQGLPLILAGGLKATNVVQAVQCTLADGVDAASGVELRPGVKSFELVQAFTDNLSGQWPFPTDN